MSDSISNILGKRDFREPPEILAIKNFVSEKFGEVPKIKITDSAFIINVSNSSLAGALRPELHNLTKRLKTKKRLIIRIN